MTHWHLTWHGTVCPPVRHSPDVPPYFTQPGAVCQRLAAESGHPHYGIVACTTELEHGLCRYPPRPVRS
jgi:hypothetical protein